MRYWVCQSCKYGTVYETKPTICPSCGVVGGQWKSSDVGNMGSFRTYICLGCNSRSVEERRPPTYPCDYCGQQNWKVFHGF